MGLSDLNVIDVLVAEFQDLVRPSIPHIIGLLGDSGLNVCVAGVDALSKLSEQGLWRIL